MTTMGIIYIIGTVIAFGAFALSLGLNSLEWNRNRRD